MKLSAEIPCHFEQGPSKFSCFEVVIQNVEIPVEDLLSLKCANNIHHLLAKLQHFVGVCLRTRGFHYRVLVTPC